MKCNAIAICDSCYDKSFTYRHPELDCGKKRKPPFKVRDYRSGTIYNVTEINGDTVYLTDLLSYSEIESLKDFKLYYDLI
jgi:hypothetical protein